MFITLRRKGLVVQLKMSLQQIFFAEAAARQRTTRKKQAGRARELHATEASSKTTLHFTFALRFLLRRPL